MSELLTRKNLTCQPPVSIAVYFGAQKDYKTAKNDPLCPVTRKLLLRSTHNYMQREAEVGLPVSHQRCVDGWH